MKANKLAKRLTILSIACGCLLKYAKSTAPVIAKEDKTMITNKMNDKLTKKKQYVVCISKEGLFSVAVVTALSMLNKDNRILDAIHGDYAVLILNMDMTQKAAIQLALSDYLVSIDTNEEPKKAKVTVWK